MQQRSRFFTHQWGSVTQSIRNPVADVIASPAGAETPPTNRFSIRKINGFLSAINSPAGSGDVAGSTRFCQRLGADALSLLSWSCDSWCHSFKIKAPGLHGLTLPSGFPSSGYTFSLRASSGSVSFTLFLQGLFTGQPDAPSALPHTALSPLTCPSRRADVHSSLEWLARCWKATVLFSQSLLKPSAERRELLRSKKRPQAEQVRFLR